MQTYRDADSPSLAMRVALLLLGCGGHHHKGGRVPRLQTERCLLIRLKISPTENDFPFPSGGLVYFGILESPAHTVENRKTSTESLGKAMHAPLSVYRCVEFLSSSALRLRTVAFVSASQEAFFVLSYCPIRTQAAKGRDQA